MAKAVKEVVIKTHEQTVSQASGELVNLLAISIGGKVVVNGAVFCPRQLRELGKFYIQVAKEAEKA